MAPENTFPAFETALANGADVLEIDVRLSRDGHVIVIHDARVDRTCDGQGAVKDLSFKELKKLNAGYHFKYTNGISSRSENIRLISLDELLLKLPDTRINIDIKDEFWEATSAVAKCIEKSANRVNINVGSFHGQSVAWFRQMAPNVTTAATFSEAARLFFGRTLCRDIQYRYLQIPVRYYGLQLNTQSFINHAKRRGLECVYWTVNDKQSMHELIRLGASGLVTDRVDIAGEILGRPA